MNTIGSNIKVLREKKGMNQSDLAREVGVSRSMMNYIEQGCKIPGIPLFALIARTLGVTMDYLFYADAERDAGKEDA